MEEAKPVENIQPPVSTPTKSKHWLLLGIIVALVAFIASVGTYYYLSQQKAAELTPIPEVKTKPTAIPTVDPTANWKTYTNPEKDYSLKIPSTLTYKEEAAKQNSACKTELIIADKKLGFSDQYQGDIVIDVCKVSQQFYPAAAFSNISGDNPTKIKVDGREGYVKTGEGDFPKLNSKIKLKRLVFFENDLEYTIDFRYIMGHEGINDFFNQILSTFKFTDQNQITDTSSWKIYTNNKYGFSVSYPSNWKTEDLSNQPPNVYQFISPNIVIDNQSINATIMVEKSNLEYRQWLKDKIVGGSCCSNNFELELVVINGQEFNKVTVKNSPYIGMITSYKGTIYYIYNTLGGLDGGTTYNNTNDTKLRKELETFGQILSTFRFD